MEIRKSKVETDRLAKYKKNLMVKDKLSSQLALKTPEAITPEEVVEEDTEVQKRERVLNNTKQLLKNRQEAFRLSSMIISNDLETFFNTNFSGIQYYVEKRLTDPSADIVFNYIKSLEVKDSGNLGEVSSNTELQLLNEILKKLATKIQSTNSKSAKDLLNRTSALETSLKINPEIISNFGGKKKVNRDLRNVNEALKFAAETSEEDKAEKVYQSVRTSSVLADVSKETLTSVLSEQIRREETLDDLSSSDSPPEFQSSSSSSSSISLRSIPNLDLFLADENLTMRQLKQIIKDLFDRKQMKLATPQGNKEQLRAFIRTLIV